MLAIGKLNWCAILIALAQPAAAEGNGVAELLGLFAGMAQQQNIANANKDWQSFPEPARSCIIEGLALSGNSLQTVVEAGIGPKDPQLQEIRDHCDTFANVKVKENFTCQVQVGATSYNSWCDEKLMAYDQNGQLTEIRLDDAIKFAYQNESLQLQQEERQDAASRRTEMMALSVNSVSVPIPNFDCAKANSPSEKSVCSSYTLAVLDAEFGDLYKRTEKLADQTEAKKAGVEEYERTEACIGDLACIQRSKEAAVDKISVALRKGGEDVQTSLDRRRKADDEKRRVEEERVLAQQKMELLAKKAEQKQAVDEALAAKAAAAKEAEDAAKTEATKRAFLNNIAVDYSQFGSDDVVVIENQGPGAPNLAKTLAGDLATATGKVDICFFTNDFSLTGDALGRYKEFLDGKLMEFLPAGAKVIERNLSNCTGRTDPDYFVFQTAYLIESKNIQEIQSISEAKARGFIVKGGVLAADVVLIEASHAAQLLAEAEAKAKLALEIRSGLKAGTKTGAGVLITDFPDGSLCYASDDRLDAKTVLNEIIARLVLTELSEVDESRAKQFERSAIQTFPDLEQLFLSLQKGGQVCGLVLGAADSLSKLSVAMDREGIAYSIPPYWIEVAQYDGVLARAKTLESAIAAEKAAAFTAAIKNYVQPKSSSNVVTPSQSTTDQVLSNEKFGDGNFLMIDIRDDIRNQLEENMSCNRVLEVSAKSSGVGLIVVTAFQTSGNYLFGMLYTELVCQSFGECGLAMDPNKQPGLERSFEILQDTINTRYVDQEGCVGSGQVSPLGNFARSVTTYSKSCGERWADVRQEKEVYLCNLD